MKNESKGTAGAPMSSINLDVFHKKVTSKIPDYLQRLDRPVLELKFNLNKHGYE